MSTRASRQPRADNAQPSDGGSHGYPSPATAITVDVLAFLAASSRAGGSLRQLAEQLDVPRSTLHRILRTLEAKQVVERVDGTGYRLSAGFLELGIRHRVAELPRLAEPVLRELHERTGETVNLAVPHGGAMLVIATVQSAARLRMVSWDGMRDLYHASALGKSYLAALPDDQLAATLADLPLTRNTPRTIVDRAQLLREIDEIRKVGFAVDDGESVEGVRCVGVAILAQGGRVVGAISVSSPASRLPETTVAKTGQLVASAAANVSLLLGATGDADPSADLERPPG
jgi:IclR family transcriptional regulator, acetate operon repressor